MNFTVLIVPLGMPIRSFEDQIIGVLHASLSLENLSEDVSNTQIGGRGYADLIAAKVLLEDNGR